MVSETLAPIQPVLCLLLESAFVEDTFPGTWMKQASTSESRYLHCHIIRNTCCSGDRLDMVEYFCLREHTTAILYSTDIYVGVHMQQIVNLIINHDIPQLLDNVRDHVQAIVDHFDQNILTANQLVLFIAPMTHVDYAKEFISTIRHTRQRIDPAKFSTQSIGQCHSSLLHSGTRNGCFVKKKTNLYMLEKMF